MSSPDSHLQAEKPLNDDNVLTFPARPQASRRCKHERPLDDLMRYPVDIRGDVAFGRLMEGLATVGLTARIDARSGRVVITDDIWK